MPITALPRGGALSQVQTLGEWASSSFARLWCGFDSLLRGFNLGGGGVMLAAANRPSPKHTQTGVERHLLSGVDTALRVRGARVEAMAPAKTMPKRQERPSLESNQTTRGKAGRGQPRNPAREVMR